jgi:hypothetical protein
MRNAGAAFPDCAEFIIGRRFRADPLASSGLDRGAIFYSIS